MSTEYKGLSTYKLLGAVALSVFAFFLFVGSVSAAEPQYQLISDINSTLDQSTNQVVGTLLFNELGVVPKAVSTSNFSSDLGAEKGDYLLWQGTSTVQASDPDGVTNFVSSGGQYFFTKIGQYSFTNPSNTSQSFVVSVVDYDRAQISLSAQSNIFGVVLSDTSFSLSGEKSVTVNITLPSTTYPSSNETVILTATSTNSGNKTLQLDFFLPVFERFILGGAGNKSVVVGLGETADVGTFVVQNTGNADYDVFVNATGNASNFLELVDDFTLFRGTTSNFPVRVRIPSTGDVGLYTSEVFVRSSDQTQSFFVSVSVEDTVAPVIRNVSFSEDELGINNVVSVLLEDRESASRVNVSWDNESRNLSFDNGVWVLEEVFVDRDPYRFVFCAVDDNNNSACVNETKQFDRLSLFNQTRGARSFPATKSGSYGRVDLFTVTRDVLDEPIAVRLTDFSSSFDTSNYSRSVIGNLYNIRLVDGDGTFKDFFGVNSTVLVESPGVIYLEVRGNPDLLSADLERVSFSGNLFFDAPLYYESLRPQSFEGDVVRYSLPQDFDIEWGDGGVLSCVVVDSGSLDTSYGDCELRIPAVDLSKDTIVPISLSQRELLENRTASVREDYEAKLSLRNALVGVGFGLCFVVALALWFLVWVRPRLLYLSR